MLNSQLNFTIHFQLWNLSTPSSNTGVRMQKKFSYKAVTTLIQICNKNVTDLLQECINFVRILHRFVNELIMILQQNYEILMKLIHSCNSFVTFFVTYLYQSCYSFVRKIFLHSAEDLFKSQFHLH